MRLSLFLRRHLFLLLQSDHLQTVSCLITDVQMPFQSGLDLLEHLTRRGFGIPAIVVSAFLNDKIVRGR